MSRDRYKIEIIHVHHPHLMWIKVKECESKEDFLLDQVGLYGLLPLEITINAENNALETSKCKDWVPAATSLIKKITSESPEIWFIPTFIDRRVSIFDDNIQKYGDVEYKTGDKIKSLSEKLIKSSLAYQDVCCFHQKLSRGEIKTRISNTIIQDIIKHFVNYFQSKGIPKKVWNKVLKTQMSVFFCSQQVESTLTQSNLEKHNNLLIKSVLESKMKDLTLCKDIDDESLGRAVRRVDESSESQISSDMLRRKLQQTKKNKDADTVETYNSIKKFLDTNSKQCHSKMFDDYEMPIVKNQTASHISDQNDNKWQDTQSLRFQKVNSSKTPQNEDFLTKKEISIKEEFSTKKPLQEKTSSKNTKQHVMLYGPPGLNPVQFVKNMIPQRLQENLPPRKITPENCDDKHYNMKVGEVESEINVNLSDKEALKDILDVALKGNKFDINVSQEGDAVRSPIPLNSSTSSSLLLQKRLRMSKRKDNDSNSNTSTMKNSENSSQDSSAGENTSKQDKNVSQEGDSVDASIPFNASTSSSLLLQKRLRMGKTNDNDSTSNTSTIIISESSSKNSSAGENISKQDDMSEDEVSKVMTRIHQEYGSGSISYVNKKMGEEKLVNDKLKNHVNPFQNMDPNISVFVDKLVTPILMVHSKLNKRIEPVYEMRDVNFNGNIHLALQNLSIKLPMMLQSVSWFTILRGYSLFMISPIGSGKTMGYLPAVCSLVTDYSQTLGDSVGPIGVIVCATAESVTNVERIAKAFLNNERVISCYAGVDDLDIATRLLNKCDLLICTPPALVRLLKAKELGVDLRRLCSFVLDDCERLAEVYVDEIKFFFIKILEIMKNRALKELKVQFILASRVWCDFMRPLAKKVTDTVICIGAFQECVLYSKANTSVSFVKQEDKINYVSKFLMDTDSRRTVVVCRTDEEVKMLTAALKNCNKYIISCNTTMTVQDLYSLNISWTEYNDPLVGPLLICCDDNLTHMNITNAHNLIHYSLPTLFSMFCKRFSVLNDNYPSIFRNECNKVNIKILLEDTNIEQFPKIINFLKRCTDSVPDVLSIISEKVIIEKDARKAQQLVPICNNLLGFGYCPDMYNCQGRHTIFKEQDMPLEWLQKKGTVSFKILHYQSAISYSVRLLSNTQDGITTKYPQTYNLISMKMSMYYSNESNRKLHGIPEVGDICAVSIKQNFFVRCQVIKILNKYEKGNPNHVLVNLIDEEKLEISRDIYLYYLPDEIKNIKSGTVGVRLANIQPLDKDITFSELALNHVKKIIESDEDLYLKGKICLIIRNIIFIDDLEVCEDLISLNKTVVKCNIIQELLGKHAKSNIDHIEKLRNLCVSSGIELLRDTKVPQPLKQDNTVLHKAKWAHLDIDDISCIYFNSAISPDTLFIRLNKFVSCMTDLAKEIQLYVKDNMIPLTIAAKGDLVLAKFPDDGTFERARVDDLLNNDKVKCFFVDYGDWRDVPLNHLCPIPEKYITKLPFQAIECRLIGVCPPGENWSDFSVNWLWDNCLEDVSGNIKPLYVKYFTLSQAEFTGGKKYNVVLVDTNTDEDVIINKLMIDLNLARENPEEIHYLDNLDFTTIQNDSGDSLDEDDDDWEKVTLNDSKSESDTISYPIAEKLIRSVPLVGSDEESDDSGRWNIHITEEFKEFFQPAFKQMVQEKQPHLPAIEMNQNDFAKDINENEAGKILKDRLLVENEPSKTTELDSDDLTSTLSSKSDRISVQSSEPNFITSVQELRRPRVVWQQNNKNVSIKIQLIVEGDYELKLESRKIIFKATANDTIYGFNIELYAVVDTHKSFHSNKGQYILIKLNKMLNKKWLFLTRDGTIKKWITYDFDSIDTSSDEEILDSKPMENIIKNSHYVTESESDNDEIIDDANFIYKK